MSDRCERRDVQGLPDGCCWTAAFDTPAKDDRQVESHTTPIIWHSLKKPRLTPSKTLWLLKVFGRSQDSEL